MKTIEEKAKAYDEAIEKLRSLHDDYDTVSALIDIKEELENIFPELKESEDEKIVKNLKYLVENYIRTSEYFEIEGEKYIAWLEKQGKQKSFDDVAKEITKNKETAISFLKSCGIMNANGELADEYKIEQCEQKPVAWSKEDEEIHRKCICAMRASACGFPEEEKFVEQVNNWLKSLKDRVQPQPEKEWSDEDESIRRRCIGAIEMANLSDYTKNDILDWLKSLKPQNTWKPSDRDIKLLKELSDGKICPDNYRARLYEIINNLKYL